MAGLLKSLPPRTSRKADAAAVNKASRSVVAQPTVKGGKSVYDRISTIVAVVNTKLGKYLDKYELLRDEEAVREYFDDIIKYSAHSCNHRNDQGITHAEISHSVRHTSICPFIIKSLETLSFDRGQQAETPSSRIRHYMR